MMRRSYEAYYTTGNFEKEGHRYQKHCGPTAITNITLTLSARKCGAMPAPVTASERFRQIVRIGRRRRIYMNTDLFHLLGGTLDLSVPFYLKRCLRAFGLSAYQVSKIRRLPADKLQKLLSEGAIAYLILRRHPVYGNHHLVCYGCEAGKRYRVADGWKNVPVYFNDSDLKYAKVVIIKDEGEQHY